MLLVNAYLLVPDPARIGTAKDKEVTNRTGRLLEHALDALALMRREGLSLNKAMARAGTNRSSMLRHAGRGLRPEGDTYVATEWDDIPRRIGTLSPDGPRWFTITDSREATRIGRFNNDVKNFAATGDSRRVSQWDDETFEAADGRHPFVTDLDLIEEFGLTGELEFDMYLRGR